VTAIDPREVRRALSNSGKTPTQVANELGISLSYFVRITRGHRRLKRNPVLRRRIADALNTPVRAIEVPQDEAA
jgi:transcriptional regulator with XRE-family HTH domain